MTLPCPPRPPVLMVPGYGNSEPEHWQGRWHAAWSDSHWCEQQDWDHPEESAWVAQLEKAVAALPRPPLLIAHSLGCSTVAAWAKVHPRPLAGAFLVAPPDPLAASFPSAIRGYRHQESGPLPFPTWVIASRNDPYASMERTEAMAKAWGARLVVLGHHGHLNLEAGFGPWPAGEQLWTEFVRSLVP